jgi:hypothetical protein
MLSKLLSPLVQRIWIVIVVNNSHIAAVLYEATRICRPIIEVGARSHHRDATNFRIPCCGHDG